MAWFVAPLALAISAAGPKPTISEFVGLNVHTVLFKPELYAPVAKKLRNYHPVEWDLGNDPKNYPGFPVCRNGVNWDALYPVWAKAGYSTSACLMFESMGASNWTDAEDAFAYGYAVGRHFGAQGSIEAVEIGNEPGKASDELYSKVFESMAQGVRRAAPKLLISSCAVRVGKSADYYKSVDCLKGKNALYDVLSIHSYAEAEPWPTFKRSYPEDPKLDYLKVIQELIGWRDKNAPGKLIWLTEFGYDSSTKKPDPKGDWAKWVGNTDAEQAQWILRSLLEFSRMDLERAYLYWFNDDDAPMMHGSSGLTRGYKPKPSFWAMAYLQKALGSYRYSKDVVRKQGEVYALEFEDTKDAKNRCWAVWVPTREGLSKTVTIPQFGGSLLSSSSLPLAEGEAPKGSAEVVGGELKVQASGTVTFVFWKKS